MSEPNGAGDLPAGLRLNGRYEVIAPISAGAMGAVYRAADGETDVDVAVKRLADVRHAARFEIEARLLSQLRHPRVVRVVDYFREETGQYLVMNLVDGEDLSELLKAQPTGRLPVEEAVEYVREACEALQYIHEQHIVHRDVKPQNLIVGDEGVVVVDFGIATEVDDEEDPGTVGIGTPKFMAPEVLAGGVVSPRSDVFGLAATLWTLLVGRPPVYAERAKLTDLVPEVPPELEDTVMAGLQIIPEHRVASVAAFARALGEPLKHTGESLAISVDRPDAPRALMEGIVKAAAGVFEAAASSIALTDRRTGELVYQSAWGAGAREVVGMRLPPGEGIAGAVVTSCQADAPDCRTDPRFAARIAAGTGYVPYTMLVVPLKRGDAAIGVLSILDRRGGGYYGADDMERAAFFAELAVTALDVEPGAFMSLGETRIVPSRRPTPTEPPPDPPDAPPGPA